MKKDKNNSIELVVLNCFIRAIKSDGMYMFFRRGIKNTGVMKSILKSRGRLDTPFSSASSTEEIVKILEKISNDMAKSNGNRGGIKDLDKYEHVTMTINHLLHYFIESNGISMDKLCSLGEEIYGLSCFKLFGDSIEEINKHQVEEAKSITDAGMLKAKLFQEYINGKKKGKISKDITFETFIRSHKKEFDKLRVTKIDAQHGQMLGASPDGNAFIEEAARPREEEVPWLDDDDDLLLDGLFD